MKKVLNFLGLSFVVKKAVDKLNSGVIYRPNLRFGRVAERSKAADLKSVVHFGAPQVRILSLPLGGFMVLLNPVSPM